MPSIETERLLLRPFRLDDLDELAALFGDPDVMRYVGTGLPIRRDETDRALKSIIKHWDQHGFGRWAVFDKTSRQFAGFGGLRSLFDTPEVVYHFSKPNWGKGLATEALTAVIADLFEQRSMHRVFAEADDRNVPVRRLLERLGFRCEACLVDADWFKGEWSTLRTYAMLDREWRGHQNAERQ